LGKAGSLEKSFHQGHTISDSSQTDKMKVWVFGVETLRLSHSKGDSPWKYNNRKYKGKFGNWGKFV
jgi:hypothetical protein